MTIQGNKMKGADNEHENSAETLLQSGEAWNGQHIEHYPVGKPEITVMKMTIPAHSELPWHTHPMPNTTYVLSGSLTIEDKAGGETKSSLQAKLLMNPSTLPIAASPPTSLPS